MQPIPIVHRRIVKKRFQRFVAMVEASLQTNDASVTTSLDEFEPEDMAAVYACLWYAYTEGVGVTFTAHPKTLQRS